MKKLRETVHYADAFVSVDCREGEASLFTGRVLDSHGPPGEIMAKAGQLFGHPLRAEATYGDPTRIGYLLTIIHDAHATFGFVKADGTIIHVDNSEGLRAYAAAMAESLESMVALWDELMEREADE